MGISLRRLGALVLFLGCGFAFSATQGVHRVRACGPAGPFDFDTLELEKMDDYGRAIELAAEGKLVAQPFALPGGEVVDIKYQGIEAGPRLRRLPANPNLRVPPLIYKSIVWIETNWSQGADDVPFGGIGPTLRSFDCGYGLGQVTTGMANSTGTPSGKQALVGTHFLYNLAEGVRILADKWNQAPEFRPVAGNGDPGALEDWYFAIWSYNGFAFSNHPLNPDRDPLRGGSQANQPLYHCYDETAPSYQGAKFGYGDYTYPERVYGCMKYPPKRDRQQLWQAQDFRMPDLSMPELANAFLPKNFRSCEELGFAGGCPAMDFATSFPEVRLPPPAQATATGTTPSGTVTPTTSPTATGNPSPAGNAAQPSPSPSPSPAAPPALGQLVRAAIVTHPDLTPPADVSKLAGFLGRPQLVYRIPAQVVLTVAGDAVNGTTAFQVENAGSGIAAFRIRTSAPWLVVRHLSDPADRSLDAGVAIGKEMDVVTVSRKELSTGQSVANPIGIGPGDTALRIAPGGGLAAGDSITIDREEMLVAAVASPAQVTLVRAQNGTAPVTHLTGASVMKVRPRSSVKGYVSDLIVTVNPAALPFGDQQGRVYIEPLLGGTGAVEIAVTASKGKDPRPFRVIVPALAVK